MKIRVLGCAGTISKEAKTSAFLINDTVLLDGGTICSGLNNEEIKSLRNIFISHPHFDHIKGLPSLAETLTFMPEAPPVDIHASELTINALRQHVMNGIIWPDFSRIPTAEAPVIRYNNLAAGVPLSVAGLTVTPHFLFHNYSDFGFLLDDGRSSLLYTSDIGSDAQLCINGRVPDAIIIEVSFPNEEEGLALKTGHLTPLLMQTMLQKLPGLPRNIFVSHLKTYFKEQIVAQLAALDLPNLVILADGDILEI
jgi:cAMP phosphodiesterase